MTTARGFKVTDSKRQIRVGIAAKNFQDLRAKTLGKFKLSVNEDDLVFQTADGTVIENEEYFNTLEAQTLLIWIERGQRAETDAEILYKTICDVNEEYFTAGEKVQEFFTEKMKNKVFKLAEVLKRIDKDKTLCSKKDEHPEWFDGLDTSAKTKEEYMFRRAQDRIKKYYYSTRQDLLKRDDLPIAPLQRLLDDMQRKLKSVNFYGCYFDRSYSIGEPRLSVCDETGKFTCLGRWNKEMCLYKPMHSINPYVSREERIIFQTWNFDHCVERSRSIVPAICQALVKLGTGNSKEGENYEIDVSKIFDDLFSTKNLKFVHIVCHDKSSHLDLKAGPYLII